MATIGLVGLGIGIAAPAWFPETFFGAPAGAVASVGGLGLILAGLLSILSAFLRPPPATEKPRALAAFHAPKPTRTDELIPVTVKRLPRRVAPDPVEEEVRELTRAISRAGVLLGTGRLSPDGYRAYVDRIKVRRADLEAQQLSRRSL